MARIHDLPLELLQHILSFIANPGNYFRPDGAETNKTAESGDIQPLDLEEDDFDYNGVLHKLCLVSRGFREIAQPLLFRHLYDVGFGGEPSATSSFTKAIYRHPHLGRHVQDITITTLPFSLHGHKSFTGEDIKFFKSVLKDLELGDREKAWLAALERYDANVFTALLTNKTPNLRGLHLCVGHGCATGMRKHLFIQNPSYLSNLEYLFIEATKGWAGHVISAFENFLLLPKLKSFTVQHGALLDKFFPITWTPGTLAIERLAFRYCHIEAGALESLFQACKKLKSFTYNNYTLNPHEQPFTPDDIPPEFTAAEFTKAALLQKDTLESFRLEFALDQWEMFYAGEEDLSLIKIGSFRNFTVLKSIVLQHAYLPAHPQFPASLKTLHITDCNASIRELCQNLATDCQNGLYPNLTEFKVFAFNITLPIRLHDQTIPQGKTPAQCFMELRDMFKGTKVDFHIIPYQLPDFDDEDEDDEYYEHDDFDDDDYGDAFLQMTPAEAARFLVPGGPAVPVPSQLLDLLMEEALQDPDFAHLAPRAGRGDVSDDSWETDDDSD
ncbi:hypothetical protein N7457_005670 [Penicillium paradoxum]|uniref:uncharacterized protein n=1 Tax=Penicillium paradoxum TaxID=176176 RepID=UPI002548624D|nr:uncharacterized protein N7457_005670 [Penicillium paradoxum]KAJ5780510.1 hypothetical protein N7457_005670 [Penicillium paradoxum]